MIHERLLEHISRHIDILDDAMRRGIDWSDILQVYSVLHALQIHAQAIIDYLLHTCATLKIPVETPITCVEELEKKGFLGAHEARDLKRLVRFRNLIVHEYSSIDLERVKKVVYTRGYRRVFEVILKLHERLEKEKLLDP